MLTDDIAASQTFGNEDWKLVGLRGVESKPIQKGRGCRSSHEGSAVGLHHLPLQGPPTFFLSVSKEPKPASGFQPREASHLLRVPHMLDGFQAKLMKVWCSPSCKGCLVAVTKIGVELEPGVTCFFKGIGFDPVQKFAESSPRFPRFIPNFGAGSALMRMRHELVQVS